MVLDVHCTSGFFGVRAFLRSEFQGHAAPGCGVPEPAEAPGHSVPAAYQTHADQWYHREQDFQRQNVEALLTAYQELIALTGTEALAGLSADTPVIN